MCGIFAYINCNVSRERRHILEVLFNGLRRLEYRGYDSAGISIDADAELRDVALPGCPPLVFREEGKIEKLVKSVYKGRFIKNKLKLSSNCREAKYVSCESDHVEISSS